MIPCGRKSGEVMNALVVAQPVERMSADISTMDEYFSFRGPEVALNQRTPKLRVIDELVDG